ncbi:exported hypothetical protein [Frankia sp. AiPs1]
MALGSKAFVSRAFGPVVFVGTVLARVAVACRTTAPVPALTPAFAPVLAPAFASALAPVLAAALTERASVSTAPA